MSGRLLSVLDGEIQKWGMTDRNGNTVYFRARYRPFSDPYVSSGRVELVLDGEQPQLEYCLAIRPVPELMRVGYLILIVGSGAFVVSGFHLMAFGAVVVGMTITLLGALASIVRVRVTISGALAKSRRWIADARG